MSDSEIQTCINYQGDGVAPYEFGGATRRRWHCLSCGEKGPLEVDAAVCRYQFTQHTCRVEGER